MAIVFSLSVSPSQSFHQIIFHLPSLYHITFISYPILPYPNPIRYHTTRYIETSHRGTESKSRKIKISRTGLRMACFEILSGRSCLLMDSVKLTRTHTPLPCLSSYLPYCRTSITSSTRQTGRMLASMSYMRSFSVYATTHHHPSPTSNFNAFLAGPPMSLAMVVHVDLSYHLYPPPIITTHHHPSPIEL
jgi:hypothetical protein